MSQTKKHCEPLVAIWLRPSTTEPCICCKQVAEKPRGEHLKNDVCMYVCSFSFLNVGLIWSNFLLSESKRAAKFWTSCSLAMFDLMVPAQMEEQ